MICVWPQSDGHFLSKGLFCNVDQILHHKSSSASTQRITHQVVPASCHIRPGWSAWCVASWGSCCGTELVSDQGCPPPREGSLSSTPPHPSLLTNHRKTLPPGGERQHEQTRREKAFLLITQTSQLVVSSICKICKWHSSHWGRSKGRCSFLKNTKSAAPSATFFSMCD